MPERKSKRRPQAEGSRAVRPVDRGFEESFVYREKPDHGSPKAPAVRLAALDRTPLTTKMRTELFAALKRATLQRKLSGAFPNTLQDILEEALEPWLKQNGYLR